MWGSGQLKHLPTVSFSQRVSERKDEKRALFRLMEIQRQVLLGYEAQHENISRPQSTPQLPDVERELESVFALPQDQQQTWYDNQLNNLEQVRRRENQLRLEGDEFHVWESGSMKECVLEITDLSEIRIHQVAVVASQHRTPRNKLEFLQRYAVEDAQQVSDQRVNEQRVCTGRWTIDMLSCIKPDSALDTLAQSKLMFDPVRVQGGVCLEWKQWQSRAIRVLVDDKDELMEVMGAHLRRYNHSRVQLVAELQEMFEFKQTVFDKNNEKHKQLLHRFWRAVYPVEPLPPVVSKHWMRLGFQGDDPATDFRSTGLLSLHCMVQYSESHPDEIRELMHMHPEREYPIAASAINVTATLTQILGLKKEKVVIPAADPRWDSPLFLFLCRLHSHTTPHPLSEVFGVLLRVLDYAFLRLRANYMQYPQVIGIVKDAMAFALSPDSNRIPPLSLADLRTRCLDHVDRNIPKAIRIAKSQKWARTPSLIAYATGHDQPAATASSATTTTAPEVAESVRDEADATMMAWSVDNGIGDNGPNFINTATTSTSVFTTKAVMIGSPSLAPASPSLTAATPYTHEISAIRPRSFALDKGMEAITISALAQTGGSKHSQQQQQYAHNKASPARSIVPMKSALTVSPHTSTPPMHASPPVQSSSAHTQASSTTNGTGSSLLRYADSSSPSSSDNTDTTLV